MTIKLIIFDLDGVLIDSKDIHYLAFNKALDEIDTRYVISRENHLKIYDGLSTRSKLKLLTKSGLDSSFHNQIWKLKQQYTYEMMNNYKFDNIENIKNVLKHLKKSGYTVYVASNCIYNTVKTVLHNTGYLEYIDYFISNDDVTNPKPSPEIYNKCMIRANVGIQETMIVEDSNIGKLAVFKSGAFLCPVRDTNDVNIKYIMSVIKRITIKSKL